MMTNPDGTSRTQSYTGLTTKYVDENSTERDVVLDALGRVQRSEEVLAKGRVIATSFDYGPFDTIKRVVDPTGHALIADYDRLGRRVRLQNSDEGTVSDSFNAFNEVIAETNGNGAKTNFNMDAAGRLVGTTSPDGTATYTWDTASHGIGKLASVTSADGIVSTFAYDDLSRLQSTTYQVGGSSYTYGYTYDSVGRPSTLTYPTSDGFGLAIKYDYTTAGYISAVEDTTHGTTIWTVTSRDPSGQLTGETFGNNLSTSRTYNDREFLTSIASTAGATTVQQLGYKYDPGGRLIHRDDSAVGSSEDFSYDPLNRLTAWNVTQNSSTVTTSYSYNDIGNLLSRTVTAEPSGTVLQSDGFTYGGSAAGEHAITQLLSAGTTYNYGYDSAGNQTAAPTRTVTYTVTGLPRTLTTLTAGSTQTGEAAHFTYDGNGDRASKTAGSASTTYAGRLFERRQNAASTGTISPLATTDVFYVTYSGRPLAAYFGTTVGGRPSDATDYIHKERLGSTDEITGANGAAVGTLKYDPYGTHRNSGNIATPASLPIGDVRRGFTAHEHDDEFDLINMRGRIYDATIAHFLTPDPLVARPLFSESYNSYTYAYNSPLAFADPSGFQGDSEDGAENEDETVTSQTLAQPPDDQCSSTCEEWPLQYNDVYPKPAPTFGALPSAATPAGSAPPGTSPASQPAGPSTPALPISRSDSGGEFSDPKAGSANGSPIPA